MAQIVIDAQVLGSGSVFTSGEAPISAEDFSVEKDPELSHPESASGLQYYDAMLNRYPEHSAEVQLRLKGYIRAGASASPDAAAYAVNPVRAYLHEIGRYQLLSGEEEIELANEIKAGWIAIRIKMTGGLKLEGEDQTAEANLLLENQIRRGAEAHYVFMNTNLRAVAYIAKRYIGQDVPYLDLIQEGNIGLHKAVRLFDPNRGCKFWTFASRLVRQYVTGAIAGHSRQIHVTSNVHKVIGRAKRLSPGLTQRLKREPTSEELADELGMSLDGLRAVQRAELIQPVSLDRPIATDKGDRALHDTVGDPRAEFAEASESAIDQLNFGAQLVDAIPDLEPRDILVLTMRFGIIFHDFIGRQLEFVVNRRPCTICYDDVLAAVNASETGALSLTEVGVFVDLTKQRINQLEINLLNKIRASGFADKLRQRSLGLE